MALVGESGSGKSLDRTSDPRPAGPTGSRRQERSRSAARRCSGAANASYGPSEGAKVALVFQEPQSASLNPSQTVGRQLHEVLRAHGRIGRRVARAAAIDLLTTVDIPEPEVRVDWYPHQLSGGQQQRVVIAMALAGRPALLIADEPTTALDVTVQARILALLRDLKDRQGLGILLITHDMGVVADIADRVVVVHGGRFVEHAPVAQLFATPTQPYTSELLAAVPTMRRTYPAPAQAPASAPILEVRDLTVTYPPRGGRAAFRALDAVSLQVGAGEVVGVVGESGSRKDDTRVGPRSGSGPPTEGIVRRTEKIALVHQDPFASLDPRWSVWRSVSEPLRVAGTRDRQVLRARAKEMLDAVRLSASYAERRPGELSGGQRQRVALARALIGGPDLIVADEPTSALDVSVQAALLDLFRQLQRERGFAALFITHDLAVVSEIADRVAVLRHGRLVEFGPTGAVFTAPGAEYTRELLAAVADPMSVRVRRREGPVTTLAARISAWYTAAVGGLAVLPGCESAVEQRAPSESRHGPRRRQAGDRITDRHRPRSPMHTVDHLHDAGSAGLRNVDPLCPSHTGSDAVGRHILGDLYLDGLRVALRLRTDVRFHSGRPLTATDVAYAIRTYASVAAESQLQATARAVTAIDTDDPTLSSCTSPIPWRTCSTCSNSCCWSTAKPPPSARRAPR